MKAVLRLVMMYAFGTRILRSLTLAGLVVVALSFVLLDFLLRSGWLLTLPFAGVVMMFLGSALMPLAFGRMARSHLIGVLPWGRVKLLASALITVTLVACPLPVLSLLGMFKAVDYYAINGIYGGNAPHVAPPTLAMVEAYRQQQVQFFYLQLSGSFYTTGLLYLALWFITSQRSLAGYVKGLIVILVIMFFPMRQVLEPSMTLTESLLQITLVWFVFGAGFLLWPRWKALTAAWRVARRERFLERLKRQVSGREIDLMLGTANPWLLIAAQVAPIAFASTIGFYSQAVWLFYLTIFSTVAGGMACQAAERSRVLWLRGSWSRGELFAQVERSFWRHNSFVTGALIALMVGIGLYAGLPVALLAIGVPLLVLSTTLSTYLGLMVTRGLRLAEGALAVVGMLALMAAAVIAARAPGDAQDVLIVVGLELMLAVAALLLRSAARRRWENIDWMLCRPDRALRARAAT